MTVSIAGGATVVVGALVTRGVVVVDVDTGSGAVVVGTVVVGTGSTDVEGSVVALVVSTTVLDGTGIDALVVVGVAAAWKVGNVAGVSVT